MTPIPLGKRWIPTKGASKWEGDTPSLPFWCAGMWVGGGVSPAMLSRGAISVMRKTGISGESALRAMGVPDEMLQRDQHLLDLAEEFLQAAQDAFEAGSVDIAFGLIWNAGILAGRSELTPHAKSQKRVAHGKTGGKKPGAGRKSKSEMTKNEMLQRFDEMEREHKGKKDMKSIYRAVAEETGWSASSVEKAVLERRKG